MKLNRKEVSVIGNFESDYESCLNEELEKDGVFEKDFYICPECGAKKIKYRERSEYFGSPCNQIIWECPYCGF